MKKLKWLLVAFLFAISFSLVLDVRAVETTEEPITEEVTAEEEFVLPDLDESFDKAKAWIVGILMSLASGGMLSIVSYVVLSRLKNNALSQVNEAVKTNAISQKQADTAVNIIEKTAVELDAKMKRLNLTISEKMEGLASKIEGVSEQMDKIDKAILIFSEAIEAYLIDNVEE